MKCKFFYNNNFIFQAIFKNSNLNGCFFYVSYKNILILILSNIFSKKFSVMFLLMTVSI